MRLSRRFLPSMSQLSVFEAAARLESFAAAAVELGLTQRAISRQMRALEKQLGTALFIRGRQTIRLTAAGEAFAPQISSAMQILSSAVVDARSEREDGPLNLAILPPFGAAWLAPRLWELASERPRLAINFAARAEPFDFESDTIDAAIYLGKPDWPGAMLDELMRDEIVPACSPQMVAAQSITAPADLLRVPLVHLSSRPNAWRDWLAAHGLGGEVLAGTQADELARAIEILRSAPGAALLPRSLIRSELQRGELVVPFDLPITSSESYYLAWNPSLAQHLPLQIFREWLLSGTRAER